MTTQNNLEPEAKFVSAILPWLVAAAALIVYLLTLNRWVSFGSLTHVARATGQIWNPELTGPVLFLVTYPFRWLPDAWVPLALNSFSMVCAAFTLALLARSVALMPHDRTYDQREREDYGITLSSLRTGWIPPVLAAAVCGLQLTFWENATAMSGDMLDLLLFAYIVRCLLEFRGDRRDSWLYRAALVYGAAMTNAWLMVALLPAFIVALLWIKGVSFFNLRFLGWMSLCGLGGLLLYLVLPLVFVMSGTTTGTFWLALKTNLAAQKNVVLFLAQRVPGNYLLLLSMTSFLPILLIAIRWASRFGDPSPLGTALTTGVFHLAHAALLFACIWVAFDPSFSPRRIGIGISALYYLSALSVGYFAGYFLLVFVPLPTRMYEDSFWRPLLNRIAQAAGCVLVVLVPAGLIFKNLPAIRLTNGNALAQHASLLVQSLPENCVVLSDDPLRLFLVHARLTQEGRSSGNLFLDTQSARWPDYQRYLQRLHGRAWPLPPGMRDDLIVQDVQLVNQLVQLSEKRPVYYLHPSFGYYFEQFYPLPHGLVCEKRRNDTNSISPPPLTEPQIAENETFWEQHSPAILKLIPFINPPAPGRSTDVRQLLMENLRIPFEPNATARLLGSFYSRCLNEWGIQMRQAGRLRQAAAHFETAISLNPNNAPARQNLQLVSDLQTGRPLNVEVARSFEDEFGKFRSWQEVLRDGGHFDDPSHRFAQARVFWQGSLLRQAAQQFERVHELVPDHVPAQYWLANLYAATRFPEKALELIAGIRARPDALEGTSIRRLDLARVESVALLSVNKPLEAEQVLQEALARNPRDEETLATVFQISTMFGRFTNALSAVGLQLQHNPDDSMALVNQGYVYLQLTNYDLAIMPLTRALALDTNNYTALLNRAIAYLQSDRLDEAQKDYERLRKVFPNEFRVYYGLGEIALRNHDTNSAIHNYELFLANCDPNSEEAKSIKERLDGLKGALDKR